VRRERRVRREGDGGKRRKHEWKRERERERRSARWLAGKRERRTNKEDGEGEHGKTAARKGERTWTQAASPRSIPLPMSVHPSIRSCGPRYTILPRYHSEARRRRARKRERERERERGGRERK